MRVLFLTKYPEEGASSRYRVYQYLPYLREHGIKCDVFPFMSPAMYQEMFSPGHQIKKLRYYLQAVLKRLSILFHAKKYDLIFMQKECLPFGTPLMERLFKQWKIPTIFDYDDALFLFKSNKYNKFAKLFKRPNRIFKIFKSVDCVLAGNNYLREQAAKYCQDARTFYVAEDLARFTPRSQANNDIITIGWFGSNTTEKYLSLVRGALREICQQYPEVRLKIVGGGEFQDEQIPIEHVSWSLEGEVAALHSFDIGIMPLPLEEWSKGKCGGKARTYMAVGLPAVCTGIGYNLELIEHGKTGFLVQSHQDWVNTLSMLIQEPSLRQQVGRMARASVEKHFSLNILAPELRKILLEIANST
jgi:glycosyltransferase involved in cell wall biosynthesis